MQWLMCVLGFINFCGTFNYFTLFMDEINRDLMFHIWIWRPIKPDMIGASYMELYNSPKISYQRIFYCFIRHNGRLQCRLIWKHNAVQVSYYSANVSSLDFVAVVIPGLVNVSNCFRQKLNLRRLDVVIQLTFVYFWRTARILF